MSSIDSHKLKLELINLKGQKVSLRDTAKILEGLELVLTESYKTKFVIKRRDGEFHIDVTNVANGSLIFDLDLLYRAQQLVFSAVGIANAKEIWELTKNAIEFLKLWGKSKSEGKTISIQDNHTSTIQYTENGNNINISVNKLVLINAGALKPKLQILAEPVGEGNLGEIKIGDLDKTGAPVRIGPKDAQYFAQDFDIEEQPLTLKVNIITFNKKKGNGRFKVIKNEHNIPEAEYRFELISTGAPSIGRTIDMMKSTAVEATVHAEVLNTLDGQKTFQSFKIVSFKQLGNDFI
jgi:hypothetical protein